MKKIISLFTTVVTIFCLCSCGENNKNEIGTTYSSNGVEFTLNYVEFADTIDNWGGANDNYWKPLPDDAHRHQLENAMTPKDTEKTICIVSYTAKNVHKIDLTIDDRGTIDYDNGYTYSDGGLAYRVSPTGVWKDIPNGITLEKLKDESYEFRAYIVIPKTIVESDNPLTYTLFGKTFNLR